jgi:anti-sigma factor RsiW
VTCREFADFIADFQAGALAGDVRDRFERHLIRCPNCQRYLTQYRDTVRLGTRAFDEADASLPDDVPEELVKAILRARDRS